MQAILASATIAAAAIAGIALTTVEAKAQTVRIERLVALGSGCPRAAPPTARLEARDAAGLPASLVVAFPNYVAQRGGGVPITSLRRNCNLLLTVTRPPRLQYGIVSARYVGRANLRPGITALQQSDYGWIFATRTASLRNLLPGPFAAAFAREARLQPPGVVYSPCRGAVPLSLRTQILLQGGGPSPASLRAERHVYRLAWRRCPS